MYGNVIARCFKFQNEKQRMFTCSFNIQLKMMDAYFETLLKNIFVKNKVQPCRNLE